MGVVRVVDAPPVAAGWNGADSIRFCAALGTVRHNNANEGFIRSNALH
jgi:hypothetical protein